MLKLILCSYFKGAGGGGERSNELNCRISNSLLSPSCIFIIKLWTFFSAFHTWNCWSFSFCFTQLISHCWSYSFCSTHIANKSHPLLLLLQDTHRIEWKKKIILCSWIIQYIDMWIAYESYILHNTYTWLSPIN